MYCPNPECSDVQNGATPAEYRDEISVCPLCGTELVREKPLQEDDSEDALSRPVPCFTLTDASLVPHAKAMLESAGIPYFVKNDRVQNLFGWGTLGGGHNFITGPPVVEVEARYADSARQLLAQLEGAQGFSSSAKADPKAGSASFCSQCKQPLEASDEDEDEKLTHCYHCGSPLTSA